MKENPQDENIENQSGDAPGPSDESDSAAVEHKPPASQEATEEIFPAEEATETIPDTISDERIVTGHMVSPDALETASAAAIIRPGQRVSEIEMENMAANGGAVGAVVLGTWSIIASLFTPYSVVNGLLGLLMGFWGLTSRRPKLAWIGIGLSLLGSLLSFVVISDIIQTFFNSMTPDDF